MKSIDASRYPGLIREYDPGGPLRVPRHMWDYQPVEGPIGVEMVHMVVRAACGGWEFETLSDAARFFAGVGLPPWIGHHWIVIDDTRTILLGYSFTERDEREYGPLGRWMGVEAGFRALEQHHDPLETAVVETMARETNGEEHAAQERYDVR